MCEDRYRGGFRCKPHTKKKLKALEDKINVTILNSIPVGLQPDFKSWVPKQTEIIHIQMLFDMDEELTNALNKEALVRTGDSRSPNPKAVRLAAGKTTKARIAANEKAQWFVFMHSSQLIKDATLAFQHTDLGKSMYNERSYLMVTGGILNNAAYDRLCLKIDSGYTSAEETEELESERDRQEILRNAFAALNQIKAYQAHPIIHGNTDCVIGIGDRAIYLVSRRNAQIIIDGYGTNISDNSLYGNAAKQALINCSRYLEKSAWAEAKVRELIDEYTEIIDNEVKKLNNRLDLSHVNA